MEVITSQVRCNRFSVIETLQRVLKDVMRRKSLSMLETIFTSAPENWFQLLMIENPTASEVSEFFSLKEMLEAINKDSRTYFEDMDCFVKTILQNKKLNEEICKLMVFITTKDV